MTNILSMMDRRKFDAIKRADTHLVKARAAAS
jgi:hypothetical protein